MTTDLPDPTPRIVVATTVAAYKVMPDRDPMEGQAWLTHAEAWCQPGSGIQVFAAVQTGHGHDEAFLPLLERLDQLRAEVWEYSIDDGADTITTGGRLVGITTGRNLAHEYVNRQQTVTHLLLLDSDVEPPADCIDRLLEVRWPMVAGHIPTYCLDGPKLACEQVNGRFWQIVGGSAPPPASTLQRFPPEADVREHWSSAGCWMLTRAAVNQLRWGWNLDAGMTDDPFVADMGARLGLGPMWTRHDVVCRHHPEAIGPLEGRGHDLSVRRLADA